MIFVDKMKQLNKKTKRILVCVGIFLICLIFWMFVVSDDFIFDNRSSGSEIRSEKEIRADIQKNTDNSAFAFRINSEIVLENKNDEADLYIRNPSENINDMYVNIVSHDTGETIFKSKKLKPGEGVRKAKLKNLKSTGKKLYTAYFHILEKDKEISEVEYEISIEIK